MTVHCTDRKNKKIKTGNCWPCAWNYWQRYKSTHQNSLATRFHSGIQRAFEHLLLQLQPRVFKAAETSRVWKLQCKYHACVSSVCLFVCAGGARLLSLCFPVPRSPPCMNTPTPTSPLAPSSIIQTVDKALISTTQTFSFFKESGGVKKKKKKTVLLHYADNTCSTGRNTVTLKYVNILKPTIFHAL